MYFCYKLLDAHKTILAIQCLNTNMNWIWLFKCIRLLRFLHFFIKINIEQNFNFMSLTLFTVVLNNLFHLENLVERFDLQIQNQYSNYNNSISDDHQTSLLSIFKIMSNSISHLTHNLKKSLFLWHSIMKHSPIFPPRKLISCCDT